MIKFNNHNMSKKLILIVFAFILINLIYAGTAFAATNNSTLNNSSQITSQSNNLTQSSNQTLNNATSNTNNTTNMTATTNVNSQTNTNFSSIQGYYINPSDTPASSINVSALKAQGINDVFVLTDRQDPNDTLEPFITLFNGTGINVYAWVECLTDFNGNYYNPELNVTLENQIITYINSIAANYNVNGIMLDDLEFPGTAYEYPNATADINNFAAAIRNNINTINNMNTPGKPHIFLSAALMPEDSVNDYYYGQNYTDLAGILNFLSPQIYVGNYGETTSWIGSTMQYINNAADGTPVVAIIQTYNSDSNPTALSSNLLDLDIQTALLNGSYGYELFRYGLLPNNWVGYQTPTPAPAPVVVSTDPVVNATEVPLNSLVNIIFNEDIATSVNYPNIYIEAVNTSNPLSLADLNINNNILTITPAVNLSSGVTYQVSIPAGAVESMSGNMSTSTYTYDFTTTTTVLNVISINPVNNATGVSTTPTITVTFNEPIIHGNVSDIVLKLTANPGTVIPTTLSISGNILTIKPNVALANGTQYTVILHSGSVTSTTGVPLAAAYTTRFMTGTTPIAPVVISTIPVNNAAGIPINTTITVTFNEPIIAGSDNIVLKLTANLGTVIPTTLSISGNILTIKPNVALANGTQYTVILHSGSVTSTTGVPLAAAYTTRFTTTGTNPAINSIIPETNAIDIPVNTTES
jgi:methionine-rich copper-binding protein CopC